MRVEQLKVEGFRNLKEFTLTPCDSANIISGDNAQGKTNLLEAIWLFTGSRSFRGNRERDYLPHSAPESETAQAGLALTFFAEGREQTASIRWVGDRRQILINGIKEETAAAFGGVFCGVVFSPDHMSLIKQGPAERRGMIDSSLTQAYPKYATALSNYQKALKQRNTLLKDIFYNGSLLDLLDLWDGHVVNYGGYIAALRDRYIRKLGSHAQQFYQGISGGKESFSVGYLPSFGEESTDGYTLEDFRAATKKALDQNRGEDLRLGSTSIGPHRDDLDIRVNLRSARSFGSQGQQRSSILALKLAECSILEEQTGESPVVMLDDVMSELDKNRRSFLLNKLEGKQVFITCCDTRAFDDLTRGSIFLMDNGRLTKEKEALNCHPTSLETEVPPCISI